MNKTIFVSEKESGIAWVTSMTTRIEKEIIMATQGIVNFVHCPLVITIAAKIFSFQFSKSRQLSVVVDDLLHSERTRI